MSAPITEISLRRTLTTIPSIRFRRSRSRRSDNPRCGGADLFIVIASPLAADRRSLTRYRTRLRAICATSIAGVLAEAGPPHPANTTIKVRLHPNSAPEVYDLLERSKDWVLANHASS